MKVLIIEDDINKIKQLAGFVRTEFSCASVEEKRSYQSGLKAATSTQYDLIILDMTLPTYEIGGPEKGGRTRAFAGREILSQLKRRSVKCKVIVVTQFERFGETDRLMTLNELKKDMRRNFAENYVGTVFYQPAESGWREDLKVVLHRVLKTEMDND
jgi:DNA-binding NarL/FixJ family response regulator